MDLTYVVYAIPMLAIWAWYLGRRGATERASKAAKEEAQSAGLVEPVSLHPLIDESTCIGCGACVRACPEQPEHQVLGLINGKANLLNASDCIGHGACRLACPVGAISLVFGTERRGIDIPTLSPEFESSVPGIYIAGELGGMGLIRKTAEQGRQAMAAIRKRSGGHSAAHDVVIIGAGPAGISAGLSAIFHKLRYKIIEQEDSLGGSVYHYPRNKLAMTAPVKLDLIGTVRLGTEVQKEKLLAFWHEIVGKTSLAMNFNERFEGLDTRPDGTFDVRTSRGRYHTRSVLLALGRRGTPRKLGVPGEETAKVMYRLVDAAQYTGRALLVVGGGDSALEAALALAAEPGTTVTLSYRGDAYARVKEKNRLMLDEQVRAGRIRSLLKSKVLNINDGSVTLVLADSEQQVLPNDYVIVCAGGELPTPLLKSIGIRFETKFGKA